MSKLFSRLLLGALAANVAFGSTSLAQVGGNAAADGRASPRRAVTNIIRNQDEGIRELVRLVRESKSPLVRKHAARTLERLRLAARFVADDLRKALKAETNDDVKKALSKAVEAVDPPLDQLDFGELIVRMRDPKEDPAMRKAAIKALTSKRFGAPYTGIRRCLQNVLVDPTIQAEVADALEELEVRERKLLKSEDGGGDNSKREQ